jgi:hypothetical protein
MHWNSRNSRVIRQARKRQKTTAHAANVTDIPSHIPLSSRIHAQSPGAMVIADETTKATANNTHRYQEGLIIAMASPDLHSRSS